jgi:hypothetical protein
MIDDEMETPEDGQLLQKSFCYLRFSFTSKRTRENRDARLHGIIELI